METYKYKSIDPKQTTCDLGVTFSFHEDVDLAEAEELINSFLTDLYKSGVKYTFDIWTLPSEDYS